MPPVTTYVVLTGKPAKPATPMTAAAAATLAIWTRPEAEDALAILAEELEISDPPASN
jgi:hypothetical protein